MEITSDNPEGVSTQYDGELQLVSKNVDFNLDVWTIDETGPTAIVKYVVAGPTFRAAVDEGAIEGYTLIYYKDNSDRFNNPAEVISIDGVVGNLPYAEDGNVEDYDYCATEEYLTCHGAKIWYVPTDAITDGELDWARADEFLFESELIQYNADGVITTYPGHTLDVYPTFTFDLMYTGTDEVVLTTVDISEV